MSISFQMKNFAGGKNFDLFEIQKRENKYVLVYCKENKMILTFKFANFPFAFAVCFHFLEK